MNLKKLIVGAGLSAALLLGVAGCSQPAGDPTPSGTQPVTEPAPTAAQPVGDPIQIATKPMTEQYILGEMLGMLIEEYTDYTVEITKGIGGGTNNIHPAMVQGEFDLYPEYTSSGYVMVLDHDAVGVADDAMFEQLKQEYHDNFGMTWVGLYGFNNTFTVAVRADVAQQYDLKTTSDLAAVAGELVFGGNPDYIERADGFNLLCETYGLEFKSVSDIDIGLKYQALNSGDIDVTNAFTTDAQLGSDNIVALEDDLKLQVNYFCSTVVREDTLAEYPGLEDVLMKMDGLLSDKEMAQLNYAVEVDGADEKDVARNFLVQKGLLEA